MFTFSVHLRQVMVLGKHLLALFSLPLLISAKVAIFLIWFSFYVFFLSIVMSDEKAINGKAN